jgi:Eco29kI restriction endonuclease.
MSEGNPYNPLDTTNLGLSVMNALLSSPVVSLPPPGGFLGAGLYAIYYIGDFPAYAEIAERNAENRFQQPIYIGKAIPAGGRKGGLGRGRAMGVVLYKRLIEHAESIRAATNLRLEDFRCRYLVVADIWIPLGEALLIDQFSPLWNRVIDGFGNHDPGSGRYEQMRSPWDVLHPGRQWALKCKDHKRSMDEILRAIAVHGAGKP